jgi:hypothetical protein
LTALSARIQRRIQPPVHDHNTSNTKANSILCLHKSIAVKTAQQKPHYNPKIIQESIHNLPRPERKQPTMRKASI